MFDTTRCFMSPEEAKSMKRPRYGRRGDGARKLTRWCAHWQLESGWTKVFYKIVNFIDKANGLQRFK